VAGDGTCFLKVLWEKRRQPWLVNRKEVTRMNMRGGETKFGGDRGRFRWYSGGSEGGNMTKKKGRGGKGVV